MFCPTALRSVYTSAFFVTNRDYGRRENSSHTPTRVDLSLARFGLDHLSSRSQRNESGQHREYRQNAPDKMIQRYGLCHSVSSHYYSSKATLKPKEP
jgi:hypothetical protein